MVKEKMMEINKRRMKYDSEMKFMKWVNEIERKKMVDKMRSKGRKEKDVMEEDIEIKGEEENVEERMDVDSMMGGV